MNKLANAIEAACMICRTPGGHILGCGSAARPKIKGAAWISLSKGLYTLVDTADADLVQQSTWRPKAGDQTFYAVRYIEGRTTQYLHRMLTGYPTVDHINGNGLDNRRANLRPATNAQNAANRRKTPGRGTSRFKGVSRIGQYERWGSRIKVAGRDTWLGAFGDEEAAARAYDTAARAAHGAFAALNFPRPGEQSALDPTRSTANGPSVAVEARTAPPAGSANHQGHNGPQEAQG